MTLCHDKLWTDHVLDISESDPEPESKFGSREIQVGNASFHKLFLLGLCSLAIKGSEFLTLPMQLSLIFYEQDEKEEVRKKRIALLLCYASQGKMEKIGRSYRLLI